MDRALKAALVLLLVLVVVPTCAFFVYDRVAFSPFLPAIRAVLAQADSEDREPPAIVRRLISAMHQRGASPTVPVARTLIIKLHPNPYKGRLGWHARNALWHALVSIHLSEDEIMGLYAALTYNGKNNGLNKLSLRMFNKPLSALSPEEAATVVAITWAPGYYTRNPDKLAERRDKLLAEVQYGPN